MLYFSRIKIVKSLVITYFCRTNQVTMNHFSLLLSTCLVFCSTVSSAQNTELTELRDMYSKTFLLPNGEKQAVIHGEPVHYFNGASWDEIDPTITATGTTLYNATNAISSVYPQQPDANSTVVFSVDGHLIELSLQKEIVQFSNGITTLSTLNNWSSADYAAEQVAYTDSLSGSQDIYHVSNGQVKNDLLLYASPSGQTAGDLYYGFRERLILPSGWYLEKAVQTSDPQTNHGILIMDETSSPQLMIPAPIIFDANGLDDNGSVSNDAAFVIEEENGAWYISTLVPSEWLNAPERSFPVTFDPTLTFAGNTGGWQSQNNFVDNPGFVFVGVCCGNLEHRAWLKWNVGGIPANACATLVELQLYVNGVGAATAELVHAFDMMTTTSTNLWGPYGMINTPVYNDQATGLYTSFTLTGTGTYGWYDLGPNAYADMTSLANTFGFFQVALVFDNEPSTNWKRFSATLCNLRVTYQDPPCSVLPIDLSDFQVECQDGQAEIKWSTVSEVNNDYFTVSKSTDGVQFTDLATVSGAGNSNELLNYSIFDDARQSELVYYRLSQTDLDGSTEYFAPQVFQGCDLDVPVIVTEQGNKVRVRGNFIHEVILFDLMGRKVTGELNESNATSLLLRSKMTSGFCVVRVLYGDNKVLTQQVYLQQ